jgi:hypothetical protein
VASSAAQRAVENATSAANQSASVSALAHAAHDELQRIIASTHAVSEEIRAQRSRDAKIRELSQDTLARMRSGAGALDNLSSAVDSSAGELHALSGASEEIRSFVTLVRNMARQSKLLALNAAMEAARETPAAQVPLHIRNAPTRLMKELGYHEGYQYAHSVPEAYIPQEYLPEELRGRTFYEPGPFGFEKEVAKRLQWWADLKAKVSTPPSPPGDKSERGQDQVSSATGSPEEEKEKE